MRAGLFALLGTTLTAAAVMTGAHRAAAGEARLTGAAFGNTSGVQRTFTATGSIDSSNGFFQSLGTNGRACVTCHRPAQAWTITPAELQERFESTGGLDPIFRTNDGSNCEAADVATPADRRTAFSLLLAKGLIRIDLPVPDGAEFEIVAVDDPYRCGASFASASMYRRPLPTTNLSFLSAVMWDGRETMPGGAIRDGLTLQVLHAVTGHAQGEAVPPAQLRAIVDFELGLFTAQTHDRAAGMLAGSGARGGPALLARQPFCIGINDPLKILPAMPGACLSSSNGLDPVAFTLFGSWENDPSPRRQAIARGEALFNTRRFVIDNVPGLNSGAADPVDGPIQTGTCTICHNTPNVGNHSIAMALNIGIADASRRTPDLPLYTLRNRATGELVETTDPGRAMVTGKWKDVGRFKGPMLRALAARAPYFHNGSATGLAEVIEFYDTRFQIRLTEAEKADLLAFLRAL
jgi:hypothetical protein